MKNITNRIIAFNVVIFTSILFKNFNVLISNHLFLFFIIKKITKIQDVTMLPINIVILTWTVPNISKFNIKNIVININNTVN